MVTPSGDIMCRTALSPCRLSRSRPGNVISLPGNNAASAYQ